MTSSVEHICAYSLIDYVGVGDRSVEEPMNSSEQSVVDAVDVNRLLSTNQIADGAKVVDLEILHLIDVLMSSSSVVLKI